MSKIEKNEIIKAIDYSRQEDMFSKLDEIYNNVPSGMCTGCGNCCMESVGINLVEFLNIYNFLLNNKELRKKSIKNIIEYYFNEYVEKNSCPFRESDMRCSIYEVRPLNCRIFGHWKKDEYEANLKNVMKRNRDYSKLVEDSYGFRINEEVTNFKIRYCLNFEPVNGYMSKSDRLSFSDETMILDSYIIRSGILDIDFKDRGIVEFFIEALMDIDLAYKIKVKISKDSKLRARAVSRLKRILW